MATLILRNISIDFILLFCCLGSLLEMQAYFVSFYFFFFFIFDHPIDIFCLLMGWLVACWAYYSLVSVCNISIVPKCSHQTSDVSVDSTCLCFFVEHIGGWWLVWLDVLSEISFTCISPLTKANKGVKINEVYCSF